MNDYYHKHATYPKPPIKRRNRRKVNGYKDKPNRVCAYCGRPYAERHEVFGGPNRQISIDHGFQVDVCREHHEELQRNITDWAQAENNRLRIQCELEFILSYESTEEGKKAWMDLIGKNYI